MKVGVATCFLALCFAAVAAASSPSRLNAAQWGRYAKANTAFTKQTTKSVARFRSCQSNTAYRQNPKAMQHCFGNSADLEVQTTVALFNVVNTFHKRTSGACDASLGTYQTALYHWRSVVTGINRAVHTTAANVATIQSMVGQAQLVYPQVTKAAAAFTAACKPKS